MIDVHVEELHATIRVTETSMVLSLAGTAETTVESVLNDLLGRLHGELQRNGIGDVLVDLYDLEFMNSSCFRSLITWIVAVRRLPEDQHYKIRFRSNPDFHWQQRSLHAIGFFGGNLVSVEN